ncbi:MAG: FtsH protease activity modulator HflK [Candidatus Delongbacteria bacterium]|nr:FtsH protease activity modulator HflK [Candidatus Delongbacteria bacterium]
MEAEFPDLKEIKLPKIKPTYIWGGLIALLVLIFLSTSFYSIEPHETGVVLTFGKFTRITQPGLHFKIPFGVETVVKVPVKRQLKQEFGFRTLQAGVKTKYDSRKYQNESLMLTGDLSCADVEWIVQYRIDDPVLFLFKARQPEETLRWASESAMRQVVGDRSVTEVLTTGRAEVALEVTALLQDIVDSYQLGIGIQVVVLQDVNPPDAVKASFNEVNQALQEKEEMINQARSAYNQVIPRARGEAAETILNAEGYALNRVNRAQGEASRFISIYNEYRKAKSVTRQRLYLEMITTVLPEVRRKIVIDDDLSGVLPLLNLNGEVLK